MVQKTVLEAIHTSKTAKLHNTVRCLLNVLDSWLKSSDEKEIKLSTFLDHEKAFDTVDHKTLLLKLRTYGIENISYN